jgi:hypothetical protein
MLCDQATDTFTLRTAEQVQSPVRRVPLRGFFGLAGQGDGALIQFGQFLERSG